MTGPDQAFIVGAQRCGTTSVVTALGDHPGVVIAEPRWPEPKFFLAPDAAARRSEYLSRFYGDDATDAALRCEKSASYLDSDVAAGQIRAAFPDAHIIVVLRDPVERALSHYGYSRAHGVEELPLLDALTPEAERRPWDTAAISASPFEYLQRGRYIDQLARWDQGFGPESVHVVILEELVADPGRFTDLERALGLEPTVEFDGATPKNAGVDTVTVEPDTRARLASLFCDSNAALALRLGRPTGW